MAEEKTKDEEKVSEFISVPGLCELSLRIFSFLRRRDRRRVINDFMKHIWWKWLRLKVYTVLSRCRLSFLVVLLILIYFISSRLFAESCVPVGKIKVRLIGIIGICLHTKSIKSCTVLMVEFIMYCNSTTWIYFWWRLWKWIFTYWLVEYFFNYDAGFFPLQWGSLDQPLDSSAPNLPAESVSPTLELIIRFHGSGFHLWGHPVTSLRSIGAHDILCEKGLSVSGLINCGIIGFQVFTM